jgi:nicotinamidase-related amidase
MDFQNMVLARAKASDHLARHMADVASRARDKGVLIIHATVQFRPGHPEVSPANPSFAAIKAADLLVQGTDSAAIVKPLTPVADDIVVTRHRTSAFTANDLDQLLRVSQISTIAIAGVQTSGCVLSTVRAGADLDYRMTVLNDCCFDADPEIQHVLIDKLFPRQADVISSESWLQSLGKAAES